MPFAPSSVLALGISQGWMGTRQACALSCSFQEGQWRGVFWWCIFKSSKGLPGGFAGWALKLCGGPPKGKHTSHEEYEKTTTLKHGKRTQDTFFIDVGHIRLLAQRNLRHATRDTGASPEAVGPSDNWPSTWWWHRRPGPVPARRPGSIHWRWGCPVSWTPSRADPDRPEPAEQSGRSSVEGHR